MGRRLQIVECMTNAEAQIATLEAEFPSLSGVAFSKARSEALASGLSVVEVLDGVIYEVFPDGTRLEKKRIALPTTVVPGTKIAIQ